MRFDTVIFPAWEALSADTRLRIQVTHRCFQANYYADLHFPADLADRMRQSMHEALGDEERAAALAQKQLKTEVARLDKQQENLIELTAVGGMAATKVRKRLADIEWKRASLSERLGESNERLRIGAALIEGALTLLDHPQGLYRRMVPQQRRFMNSAFFEKLYVHQDMIVEAVLRPPFDDLIEARDRAQQVLKAPNRQKALQGLKTIQGSTGPLANIFFAVGSNKALMVGAAGLEPTTCWL
jgi:site-specific DNA recombinase